MTPVRAVPAALESEAEQFRRLVDSVTDYAIFMLDREGRVSTWNPGAQRLKGYAAPEILGQHFELFFPEEARREERPRRALEIAARTGRHEDEGWRVRKDGSRFWANAVLTPVRDEAGQLLGFAKVTRDLSERRRAEVAAQEEAQRLKEILDCLSDAVSVCDTTGRFIHHNRAADALTGSLRQSGDRVQDSVGKYGVFLPDGNTPFPLGDSTMLRALRGEESDGVEALMRNPAHPEGVHLSVNTRPLRDAAGTIVGAVVVAHDISRRVQAEQELARQRNLLRLVLDCVVETVSVYDLEGRMVLSNPAFDAVAGKRFAPGAAADERLQHYGLFTGDGHRRLAREEVPAVRAMRGEEVADFEVLMKNPSHPDGVLMSTNARGLRDPDGQLVGAVVTARDVTARRRAELALVEQKDLLSSILDALAEAVMVYDMRGRILLANPAAQRMLGHDPTAPDDTLEERARERTVFTLDGTRRLAVEETPIGRAMRGEAVDDAEIQVQGATLPALLQLSTTARPLRDAQGSLRGAVATVRDIGARIRAEREREKLLAELNRSNAELSQFAYAASHDLRAPLRAIDSLAQWIEDDLRPHFTPETAEQMSLLHSRVRRMETLLRDLLEFSRAGQMSAAVQPVDVDRLVGEVIDLLAPPAGFTITRDVAVGALETAALPLRRVLLNLIGNALKHHDKSEGRISVSARLEGAFVVFTVADDGPGIPERFHAKVFDMFSTLRRRDDVEASGMGLALVKKIVESANGTISLASSGRGASFRFTWPRRWAS